MKDYNPKPNPKDGAIGNTAFLNELILKIGAKVMLVHNVDVPDMLTNGQLGVLKDVIRTDDKKIISGPNIQMLVVELKDKKAGKANQKNNAEFAKKYPGCVFLERVSWQYSLTKRGKNKNGGTTATVIQFPLRVAHGITAHKIQGQSILFPAKVAMDLQTVFEPAQAYVMLSRIQCLEQLIIVDKLVDTKIKTYESAQEELRRLERISLNRNPTPWDSLTNGSIKIASLNCAGFFPHLKDLSSDLRLMKGDIVHVDETSITHENTTDHLEFAEHGINFISVGLGKGIAAFVKIEMDHSITEIEEEKLQIMKISLKELDSINVYRSAGYSLKDTFDKLEGMIDHCKATLITGDFNVCLKKNPDNELTRKLKEIGFSQSVDRATHVEGGHIDHMYWRDFLKVWTDPQLEIYSPYYSDHDALLITLVKR